MPSETRLPGPPGAIGRGPRVRILYTLLAVLLITGLVPLSIAAYKQIAISRESLITSTQENQLMVASSIARSLGSQIDESRVQLLKLGDLCEAVYRQGGPLALREVLQEPHAAERTLGTDLILVRYLPSGGVRFQALRKGTDLPAEIERMLAREAELARRGERALTDPVPIDREGRKLAVAFSAPIGGEGDGPPSGILQGLIDMSALWERAVGNRPLGYTLYALDKEGNLFGSLDEQGFLARTDLKQFSIVQKFLASATKSAETSDFTLTLDGVKRDFLASVDVTRQGWGIFVQVEKRLAYASVQEMIRSTINWAVVALALALIFGVWLTASIARPINQLAETARAFARGEFSARADIRSHSELGELAETFNKMSDQIQDHIKKLHAAALENQELFLGTIKALAAAIDEKDPYTRGHSDRVSHISVLLAREMGLGQRDVRNVQIGSLLHDVGKIGIDDRILRKPSVLTEEEYRYMKLHPTKGAAMLDPIKNMKDINPAVKHHHERWDGGGYPAGLKGEEIPLIARIVNVADTFDAMTTNRPYQKAMTLEKAVARLHELAGSAHDPKLVGILSDLVKRGDVTA